MMLPTICFVPFWLPPENHASTRIRALAPAEILSRNGYQTFTQFNEQADIFIITQLCTDKIYEQLKTAKHKKIIYDICDRHFADNRLLRLGDGTSLNIKKRCAELMALADIIITPTALLRDEIARLQPHKTIMHIPEAMDYERRLYPAAPHSNKVLWFGQPQRGNFASSAWMLTQLQNTFDYQPLIISQPSFFEPARLWQRIKAKLRGQALGRGKFTAFGAYCKQWSYGNFTQSIKPAGLCVISHSKDEQGKSANRLVTAIAHGIPALIHNAPACAEILREAKCDYAIIRTADELNAATDMLRAPSHRAAYIKATQEVIEKRYDDNAIAVHYEGLINKVLHK